MITKLTINFAIEHVEPLKVKSADLNRRLDLVTPLGLTYPTVDALELALKELIGPEALGIKPYGMTTKKGRTCTIKRSKECM